MSPDDPFDPGIGPGCWVLFLLTAALTLGVMLIFIREALS